MNERILELAEKAFDLANEEIDAKCEGRTGMDGQLGIMYRTFAELLVRECAIIAFEEWQHNGTSGESAILKHFGVE